MFQPKQSSGPGLRADSPVPFLGGLWAERGTEMVMPARDGLWDALARVTSPGLTYLYAGGKAEPHSSTSSLVSLTRDHASSPSHWKASKTGLQQGQSCFKKKISMKQSRLSISGVKKVSFPLSASLDSPRRHIHSSHVITRTCTWVSSRHMFLPDY